MDFEIGIYILFFYIQILVLGFSFAHHFFVCQYNICYYFL